MEDSQVPNQINLENNNSSSPNKHDLKDQVPVYVQKAMDALRGHRHVIIHDGAHMISPLMIQEVHNRINLEYPEKDLKALYLSFFGITSMNDIVERFSNNIFFHVSKDDIEMCAYAREFIMQEHEIRTRYDDYGFLYSYINIIPGENPIESAHYMVRTCDILCSDTKKRFVVCLDDIESIDKIKNIKERNAIITLFQMYLLHMENVSFIMTTKSKPLYEKLTARVREHQGLCFDLTPFTSPSTQAKEKAEAESVNVVKPKRGRPPKNKQVVESPEETFPSALGENQTSDTTVEIERPVIQHQLLIDRALEIEDMVNSEYSVEAIFDNAD